MAHVCSLYCNYSPYLLKEEEQDEVGVLLRSGKKTGRMLFANDFVGVSDSTGSLQKLIDVVHGYYNKCGH